MSQPNLQQNPGSNLAARSTIRFVAPVLVSLAAVLAGSVASIELLSSIRAYVGGEGLYSKGQKNATYYLARYAMTRSLSDYRQYQNAIAVPLGDRQARLALQRRPVNVAAARAGFLQGGNAPTDLNGIVALFRLLGPVGPFKRAIAIWTQGDSYTMRLCRLAAQLRAAGPGPLSRREQAAALAQLDRINGELTPLAARFSATLGEAAREACTVLILALILGTGITAVLCVGVTRARVRERLAKEQSLARLTELYAALSRTSQLVSRVRDREQLFDELCRICVDTSGLALAAVGLVDGSRIDFAAAHGVRADRLPALAGASGNAGSDHALQPTLQTGGSSVVHRNKNTHSVFSSEAAFALHCQSRIAAVLCVFSEEAQFFSDDIVQLLDRLAAEVSFALENLHHEAERRRQSTALADQNRILGLIASGAELEVIFATLAQFLETQSAGARCALIALPAHGGREVLTVAPSLPPGFAHALDQAVRRGDGDPCLAAIAERTPIRAADLSDYPLDARVRILLEDAGLRSARAWPILGVSGELLGAISLYSPSAHEDSALEVPWVRIGTDLAGIAIESDRAAARIRHLAHHDDLTGLPNRLLFNNEVTRSLAIAQRTGTAVGILFLDLDRFKIINDTLGHAAGDSVLSQVARHLKSRLTAVDLIARLGGDEFAILVKECSGPEALGTLAHRLLGVVADPVIIGGREFRLSASIGVAIYPTDGIDGTSLLKHADIAMYRAKESGRNNYQFYSHAIDDHSLERLSLENDLRQAIAHRQFEVHYQPKIRINTGQVAGAEALVRWRHPQRGLLLAGEFIRVAEDAGLIGSIGTIVLETVCRDIVRWRAEGRRTLRVALNLSAQQFADSRFLEDLDRILAETGCDPQLLELEITESVVMGNPEDALRLLEHIKTYGITLAIDDFGTGYSSLAYLKRFPVDSVKIDYAFVRDIASDPDDLAITKVIIGLGHSLGLKVVAEGVETVAQLEILKRASCDEYQGFLFSAAIPAETFSKMLPRVARPEADETPLTFRAVAAQPVSA